MVCKSSYDLLSPALHVFHSLTILAAMRAAALFTSLFFGFAPLASAVPASDVVAVLYNSAVPESRQLAELYAEARHIPPDHLIGLRMPTTADVSRRDYEESIVKPLRDEFDQRRWWQRARDRAGITMPISNKIQVLVTVRGVPLRIQPIPKPAPAKDSPPEAPKDLLAGRDEAAVDSELAMFGVEGLPTASVLQNKYYQSNKKFSDAKLPFLILTSRIDGPSVAACERMIRDPIETEKTGLWGMAYVDIANKFPQGDQWLESIVKSNAETGIPTVADRFNETLPKNYPMEHAAVYFGWYDWNVNGPFMNPRFHFRKGAIAVHLHSYSAQQLSHPNQNWCAPLIERGAAVTVGNVYEPYLHLTHDLGMLYQRLLDGYSWVEACWMSMPVTSWQSIVLGDPLYQPFRHLSGMGNVTKQDREFRALRAAVLEWPDSPGERRAKLDHAASRMASGVLAEAVGLELLARGLQAEAVARFRTAKSFYTASEDKLRQDFHIISMDRTAQRKELALRGLRDAQTLYGPIPESEALAAWINLLDPPLPPPPAGAAKTTKQP